MSETAAYPHHRDSNGDICRAYGHVRVEILRGVYGPSFAEGSADGERLADVLACLDDYSLTVLVHDHEHGRAKKKIQQASASKPA
jgi:hypothetical protein